MQGWGERRSYERRSERRSLIVNECANGVHFHAVNESVNGVQKFGERVKWTAVHLNQGVVVSLYHLFNHFLLYHCCKVLLFHETMEISSPNTLKLQWKEPKILVEKNQTFGWKEPKVLVRFWRWEKNGELNGRSYLNYERERELVRDFHKRTWTERRSFFSWTSTPLFFLNFNFDFLSKFWDVVIFPYFNFFSFL